MAIMAHARGEWVTGVAVSFMAVFCLTFAGWTIWQFACAPAPVKVDPDIPVSPNPFRRRIDPPHERQPTAGPEHRNDQTGR
jgi:hypothetical protein